MYEGITYEEFKRLTEKEKCDAYKYLSDHDKFRARISSPAVGRTIEPDPSQIKTEEELERKTIEFYDTIGLGDKFRKIFEEKKKNKSQI